LDAGGFTGRRARSTRVETSAGVPCGKRNIGCSIRVPAAAARNRNQSCCPRIFLLPVVIRRLFLEDHNIIRPCLHQIMINCFQGLATRRDMSRFPQASGISGTATAVELCSGVTTISRQANKTAILLS
jgi:hypothetical protein